MCCFGEMLWDLHERGDGLFERHLGGASANVAIGLARLGMKASVAGAVGDDRFGEELLGALEREGIDTRDVLRAKKRTAVTFITRDGDGEPRFHNYREGSADDAITRAIALAAAKRAGWLVLGAGSPASTIAAVRALDRMRGTRPIVVVDVNARPRLWTSRRAMDRAVAEALAHADLVKASVRDLEEIAGASGARAEERFRRSRAPKATWVITRGADGAHAYGAHGGAFAPSLRARCVDATGAGDAFLAGLIAALSAAHALPGTAAWNDAALWTRALEVGHSLGKLAVSKLGATAGLARDGAAMRAARRRLSLLGTLC